MTETLIDLRALLVEREEFEGGMVSKLREGLAQGGPQIRTLREIIEILNKRLAVAAGPQQKKIHLKLGIAHYFIGSMASSVENLEKSEGPLAAFYLGQAHVNRHEYKEAIASFEKAEKSGYAAQQVQLQRAGVLRLQGQLSEAKAILVKLKDAAAHNAEFYFQEGGIAEAEGDSPRSAKHYERSIELEPRHAGALFRLGFLNDRHGNDHEAIGFYERCLKYPPIG